MSEQDVEKKVEEVAAQPATPVVSKAEAWKSQGKCPVCGKPVFRPKEDGLGGTCTEHLGKIRQSANVATAIPEGWLKMSAVCRTLEKAGFSTGFIVKACGGDATTGPVVAEIFRPTYVGNRKYLDPRCITEEGIALLKKAQSAPKPDAPTFKATTVNKPAETPAPTAVAGKLKAAVKK